MRICAFIFRYVCSSQFFTLILIPQNSTFFHVNIQGPLRLDSSQKARDLIVALKRESEIDIVNDKPSDDWKIGLESMLPAKMQNAFHPSQDLPCFFLNLCQKHGVSTKKLLISQQWNVLKGDISCSVDDVWAHLTSQGGWCTPSERKVWYIFI